MRTAIDKSKNGYTEEDNRGKTGSRNYPEAVLDTVKNHIKKFPVMESHHVQEKSKRHFLASNLNIHIQTSTQSEKEIEVNMGEQTYRNVCNSCFNLSFHKPKKDRCETCIEFENTTPQQKTLFEEKYQTPINI